MMLPNAWDSCSIESVYDFTKKPRGIVYSEYDQVPFIPMEMVPIDRPYINNHNIKNGRDIRSGNYFEKGDVLLAKITPFFENGKQGIAKDIPGLFGVASAELIPIREKSGISSKYFLFYYLLEKEIRKQITQKMEGTTGRQRIPISVLKKWVIPFPSLKEQEKIAAVLLKNQHAIEVQESIVEAARELKRSTMQHVFTYGLRGEKTKETETGRVPESWGIVSLEDLCAIERGKFTHRPRNDPAYYGGNIPFVQTGDVANSNGRITNYSQTLNELGLSVSRIFPKGTILITIAANIGDTGILEFDSAFPDSIIGLTVTEEINGYYLEYYLRTQKRKMMKLAPKGTQLNINIQFLRPWPVLCPGIEEQIEIAETFQSIDNKIELHTTKKDVLQDLFKTMLNKLMTGQIRVKDLDIDTSWVMEMKNKG